MMLTLSNGFQLKNFDDWEFLSCVPACTYDRMDNSFLMLLQKCRDRAGIPFHLNSAFRSREYEKSKGRSGNSFHCAGCAVDIRCVDASSRAIIVKAALEVGIYGIGIANTFIHLDNRVTPKIWLYE